MCVDNTHTHTRCGCTTLVTVICLTSFVFVWQSLGGNLDGRNLEEHIEHRVGLCFMIVFMHVYIPHILGNVLLIVFGQEFERSSQQQQQLTHCIDEVCKRSKVE